MRTKRSIRANAAAQERKEIILFWVGPYRMGIDARALQEIRNVGDLAPKQLEGVVMVSAHELLGVSHGPGTRVLVLRNGRLAIRVDRVERMVEASAVRPLPGAFRGAEREWYCGLAMAGDAVVPLLNPEVLKCESLQSKLQLQSHGEGPQDSITEGG